MALHEEAFKFGVVTVEVTTTAGECHIEDWNPKDADEALDYARETAQCSNVSRTVFKDNRSGHSETFNSQALAAQ